MGQQAAPSAMADYYAGFTGGYDPGLYKRLRDLAAARATAGAGSDVPGLLDTGGGGGGVGPSDIDTGQTSSTSGGFSLSGLLGGGSPTGNVSTGMGGFSLSPSGQVTANTMSPGAAMLASMLTGLPFSLAASAFNQSANQAAANLSAAIADTQGLNTMDSDTAAATAGPAGTGGPAASAASQAASMAVANGLTDAQVGQIAQAAANAVIGGTSVSQAVTQAADQVYGMLDAQSQQQSAQVAQDQALAQSEAQAIADAIANESGLAVAADAQAVADAIAAAADVAAMGDVGMGSGVDSAGGYAAADGVGSSGFDGTGSFGSSDGGGGGGGGGGKIICTKLHDLGLMPRDIYEADQAFGALLVSQSPQTYAGYVVWAKHIVKWMDRKDLFGAFVRHAAHAIATPWSIAMAQEMGLPVKSSWFGRALLKNGLRVCQFIGKMNQVRGVQNV